MAIKAGQILHVANQFVVDRIQTGGAGNLNIPQEKIHELGNYQSVGIVRDVPDLTFTLDCLNVDTEVESLLTGSTNPNLDVRGTAIPAVAGKMYDLALCKPIDIISPWKTGQTTATPFSTVRGVAIPALSLESASYKYGLKENAGENFSLRGDSIYYIPGTPWHDVLTGAALTGAVWTFAHGPALAYKESGNTLYALSLSVNGQRLTRGSEYTETATTVTFAVIPAATDVISVIYGSAVSSTYPQSGLVAPEWRVAPTATGPNNDPAGLVHQTTALKPAAIRGKDIDVYFSTLIGGTATEVRWPDVQSVTVDWKVTIEDDYEFGNPRAVNRDFADVPAVTGTIELKPRSILAMFTRLQQITGVPATEIIGPQSSVLGALRVELRNPESGGTSAVAAGTVLKTHYVPDARFTIPGYEGRVQQKLTTTVNWESDGGILQTYKGSM